MSRVHNINGVKVPFTADEERQREAEEQEWVASAPQRVAEAVYRDRRAAYPAIGDQLDALYHAGVFPAEMADKLKAVKAKYPKGAS